jgi:hypothetical protein
MKNLLATLVLAGMCGGVSIGTCAEAADLPDHPPAVHDLGVLSVHPPLADPLRDVFAQWVKSPGSVTEAAVREAERSGGQVMCFPVHEEANGKSGEQEVMEGIASAVVTLRKLGASWSLRVIGGVLVGLLYPTEMGDDGIYPPDADGCCPPGTIPVVLEPLPPAP